MQPYTKPRLSDGDFSQDEHSYECGGAEVGDAYCTPRLPQASISSTHIIWVGVAHLGPFATSSDAGGLAIAVCPSHVAPMDGAFAEDEHSKSAGVQMHSTARMQGRSEGSRALNYSKTDRNLGPSHCLPVVGPSTVRYSRWAIGAS